MTATDELRRMLDERGVEYASSASGRSVYIGPNTTAFANYSEDTLDVSMRNLTPEQAIEATLGRGTCEMQRFESGTNMTRFGWRCTECGMASIGFGRPNYCSKCGRQVVK